MPNHPAHTKLNCLYFKMLRARREGYAEVADQSEVIQEIKALILRGRGRAAFGMLDELAETIKHVTEQALALTEHNHKLTMEGKMDLRHKAEFCRVAALRDGEEAVVASCTAAIDDIDEWMALSIEYLNA